MKPNVFTRDVAVKVTTKCRQYRIVAASTTNVLAETMKRHELLHPNVPELPPWRDTHAATILPQLASTVTLANLWAALLNSEERVRVDFHGAHGTSHAESLALGETRAYVGLDSDAMRAAAQQQQAAGPTANPLGVTPGTLRVHRVLYGHMQPFTSTTLAPSGSAEDTLLMQQAMHHSAQSDGVRSAVLLACALDPATAAPLYNCGVLVQPIAPSEARTGEQLEVIAALQQAFTTIMQPDADDDIFEPDEESGVLVGSRPQTSHVRAGDAAACREALDRRLRLGWGPHDLLALGSGDWAGARRVADAGRLLGGDAAQRLLPRAGGDGVAPVLDEYQATSPYAGLAGDAGEGEAKRWVGFDPKSHGTASLELDESTLVKTPLDFFCRCSKAGVQNSLTALGREGVAARFAADPRMPFRCHYCATEWRLEDADWRTLLASLSSAG